ncbi:MAG: stalk domain-containing protein [Caldisericia bacterium]
MHPHKMYLQIGNKSWGTNGISIEKNLDSAPMINNDRTFVEIRSILEKAGAELSWIEEKEQLKSQELSR